MSNRSSKVAFATSYKRVLVAGRIIKLNIVKMIKPRIIGGYQNTKLNNEDIALTPYLFGVSMNGIVIKIFGIGLCWLHYSVYLGIGFNVPKNYPTFKILRLKDKT